MPGHRMTVYMVPTPWGRHFFFCVNVGRKQGFEWFLRNSRTSERSARSGAKLCGGEAVKLTLTLTPEQRPVGNQSSGPLDQVAGILCCPFWGACSKWSIWMAVFELTEHVTEHFHFLVSLAGWTRMTLKSTFWKSLTEFIQAPPSM